MAVEEGSFFCASPVVGCLGCAEELSGGGEDGDDVGADLLEKLHAEPYPRVRYFMTVSVPNANLSAS
jgi:hypothetical protein